MFVLNSTGSRRHTLAVRSIVSIDWIEDSRAGITSHPDNSCFKINEQVSAKWLLNRKQYILLISPQESTATEKACRIEMLGGMRVIFEDRAITGFRTRKTAELLAYLAYFSQRAHPREVLIELLWPEADADAGRHSLSMALSSLRKDLEDDEGESIILADRHTVGIDSALVRTDVSDMQSAIDTANRAADNDAQVHLTAAIELYKGELLPGFYGDWVFPEQQRQQEKYLQALRSLVNLLERAGKLNEAICFALQSLSFHRTQEEAHREVIRLYMSAGRPDDAHRQFRELERLLKAELDSEPTEETRALLDAGNIGKSSWAPDPRHLQFALAASTKSGADLPQLLEAVGGAMSLNSPYYVTRDTDAEFQNAISRRDSIVLVKGARQVGKSSLLARSLQKARTEGQRVILTHFQALNAKHLESIEAFFLGICDMFTEQLDLGTRRVDYWDAARGPSQNFRHFLRRKALPEVEGRLIWAMDEVDRLLASSFATEVFALFRSWHDERALDPEGPWEALTLAMAYSTEPHLFITDLNQSPFNVGTRLSLSDFSTKQLGDLNQRYGSPLRNAGELGAYVDIVGGQPFLVQRGLHEMAARGLSLDEVRKRAANDEWVFGEHLRRLGALLQANPELAGAVQLVIDGKPGLCLSAFHRLRSAGILSGESTTDARFRCPLYRTYLQDSLS